MRRVTVVLSLVLLGLPVGQTAAARPLIEGQKGWDCRTMGNRTCSTSARVAELAGIIEGQAGWDCGTMGNGVCGTPSSDLSSVVLAPASVGTTERASVSSNEEQANARSTEPDISRTGRFVAFVSFATNLVPGDTNGVADVFVRDRISGTTERVNVSSSEAQANADIQVGPFRGSPSISAGGRFVAFASDATNLVAADNNGATDIFVRDRLLGTTERVSVGPLGTEANSVSGRPDLSEDGRFVAFESHATNLSVDEIALTAADPVLHPVGDVFPVDELAESYSPKDVFVHDRQLDITERVSVNDLGSSGGGGSCDGPEGCGPDEDPPSSGNPSISADGRFVAFESWAPNMTIDLTQAPSIWDDTMNPPDVFVRDRLLRRTRRVSDSTVSGFESGGYDPNISGDGRFVAFESGGNLTPQSCYVSAFDVGTCVYVHDLSTGLTKRVDLTSGGQAPTPGRSHRPSLSDVGRIVAFDSENALTADGSTSSSSDVYFRDRGLGTTTLESLNNDGVAGNGTDHEPAVSGNGSSVAWLSNSTNLVPNDTNGVDDIFVHVH